MWLVRVMIDEIKIAFEINGIRDKMMGADIGIITSLFIISNPISIQSLNMLECTYSINFCINATLTSFLNEFKLLFLCLN
jgi:hypothetical protein